MSAGLQWADSSIITARVQTTLPDGTNNPYQVQRRQTTSASQICRGRDVVRSKLDAYHRFLVTRADGLGDHARARHTYVGFLPLCLFIPPLPGRDTLGLGGEDFFLVEVLAISSCFLSLKSQRLPTETRMDSKHGQRIRAFLIRRCWPEDP